MRLFAVHDVAGTIIEVTTCPTDAPPPALITAPGLAYTEIEPPDHFPEDPSVQELQDFMKAHRVDMARQQESSPVPLTRLEDYG
jgi:hypothetical protein